jgi:DNA-binding response OmpR family regulator
VPLSANDGMDLYEFGPFRLDPRQRLLLRDDKPIPLQPKAFETVLGNATISCDFQLY